MPFRFPLDTVLCHLRRVEREKEFQLHRAHQEAALTARKITALDQSLTQMSEEVGVQLQQGYIAAKVHLHLICKSSLEQQRVAHQEELARRRAAAEQCRSALGEARRSRKAVENLRERRALSYQRESERREQRELDDLLTLRHNFPPSG